MTNIGHFRAAGKLLEDATDLPSKLWVSPPTKMDKHQLIEEGYYESSKEEFDKLGLSDYKEFIHFGLTSQDINNTAIPLSIKDAMNDVYVPEYLNVLAKIETLISSLNALK